MKNKTVIDLIRHGEPEGGRMYRGGGTDHALSEDGWKQMLASDEGRNEDWSAIVSSPMLRCKGFATHLAKKKDIPLEIIENLREAGYGDWEGLTPSAIKEESEEEYWQFFSDPVNCRPTNAEPLEFLRHGLMKS
ncbi:MAG: histidine phosphatase family protein [Cocleimonas sp.]